MSEQKQNLYFYYYVKTNELKKVSKKAFLNSGERVLVFGRSRVRVIGECERFKLVNTLRPIVPQGLFDVFSEIKDVLNSFVYVLSSVKKINSRVILAFTKLTLEIINFYNSPVISGSQIINIILSVYLFREELQPQGFESLFIAGLSTFLPAKLFDIVRRAQVLSNSKLCDDPSLLYSILGSIFSFIEDFIGNVPGASFIKTTLGSISSFFCIGKQHLVLKCVEKLLVEAEDSKVLLAQAFRDRCDKVKKQVNDCLELQDWCKRSGAVNAIMVKWNRLIKLVESYNNPYRQEPSCFIFEGPPGKMKSVILNNIVQALKEPCYSHIVKAVGNGKDFYDNYNNEPIFYMDDLGQEGVSQWRTIMNMVSAVKLPLDCAEASLKDTKFFNSDKIFITTNKFQNIHGITKTDCIDDLKALHRRGYVFDFSAVSRDGDFIVGDIVFKYFHLQDAKFINDFPPEFKKVSQIKPVFSIKRGDPRCNLIAWFVSIIKVFDKVKKTHLVNNKLTDSEVEIIQQLVETQLEPQGLFDSWVDKTVEKEDITIETVDNEIDEVDLKLTALREELYRALGDDSVTSISDVDVFTSPWWQDLLNGHVVQFVKRMVRGIKQFVLNNPEAASLIVQLCVALLLGVFVGVLSKWLSPGVESSPLVPQSNFKYDIATVHSSIPFLERNLFEVDIVSGTKKSNCVGVFSGHYVLLPGHLSVSEELSIVVYENRNLNKRIIDGDVVSLVFLDKVEDLGVYKFAPSFPSPFKKLAHLFKPDKDGRQSAGFLVSVGGWLPIGKVEGKLKTSVRQYRQPWPDGSVFVGTLVEGNYATYDYEQMGLCGSLLYSVENGILGMHVAGDPARGQGVSILWSSELRHKLKLLFDTRIGCELPFEWKSMKGQDVSVLKLDADVHAVVPSLSSIGPSPLFGIYPVTRSPANLKCYGHHTVKDVAKKSFSPCVVVDSREIEFGKLVLRSMLRDFEDMSEFEIVGGTDWLAGLNKKSSNGFKCEKEKSYYIDFASNSYTEAFKTELAKFEEQLDSYEPDWEKLIWVETLKDELRGDEKAGEPRSFRVGTIFNQVLTKKYFGRMVEHIIQNRSFNQIMIGCNPIREWPKIYNKLIKGRFFAGDIKKWDGQMPSQVQRAVIDVILEFYKGKHKVAASILLESIIHSLLVVQDDMYLTTHSMSSGSFLTAIMNSMVNKFYTAMWYYRTLVTGKLRPTLENFWYQLDDFVYGDDKLNVIRVNSHLLNALSMKEFFMSLGMDFTDSNKRPITVPFQEIDEISFLKRGFVWHDKLLQVVCPLDLRTLFSGLSYVDYDKDVDVVMRDKLHAFQREIYLHPNREELLADFKERIKNFPVECEFLDCDYIRDIYLDPNFEVPVGWTGTQYM